MSPRSHLINMIFLAENVSNLLSLQLVDSCSSHRGTLRSDGRKKKKSRFAPPYNEVQFFVSCLFLTHIISLSPLFHFPLSVSVRGFYNAILPDMHLAHYLKQILILLAVAYTVDELSCDSAEKQIKQSDRKGKKKKQHAGGGFAGLESRKIETDLIVFMPLNVTAG